LDRNCAQENRDYPNNGAVFVKRKRNLNKKSAVANVGGAIGFAGR
jgi:hypothetical protein